MLQNYIKVGIRNLLKNKVFSIINIFGLAVAMSVCMLIMLMWEDQTSYDQFHANKDNIYRIVTSPNGTSNMRATIPYPTIETLKNNYSSIEDGTTLRRGFGGDAVYTKSNNETSVSTLKGYFADASFLKIFGYELEEGDPKTALNRPNAVIVSKEIATKLFSNENPIGKTFQFSDRGLNYWTDESNPPVNWGEFTITGVFKDTGFKSHLKFEALASTATLELLYKESKIADLSNNWSIDHEAYGYVMLKKSSSITEFQNNLKVLSSIELANNTNESLKNTSFTFQPLTKITPGVATGNSTDTTLPLFVYYVLFGLAFIIMLSACLNYTSLSVARAITRSNEIGVRKVNGAMGKDLILQFVSESVITVFAALVLANIFLLILKGAFLKLWLNQYLNFDLKFNFKIYMLFVGFAFIVGLMAGFYPAFRMSRFNPVKALKNISSTNIGKMGLRKVLAVSQFVLSMIFIVTSIVVYNQVKYYMDFDYGFNPKNVLNINLQSNDYEKVKDAFSKVPGVEVVSACSYIPADGRNDNVEMKLINSEEKHSAIDLSVDENFTDVLEIAMVAGKKFTVNSEGYSDQVLVNEQASKELGFNNPEEIVGQFIEIGGRNVTVSGVFKDFTFFLLFNGRSTGPLVFQSKPSLYKFATVRINPGSEEASVERLKEQWSQVDKIHPMDFEFYNYQLADNNQGIFDIVSIIGFLSFITIMLACLGMFGMAHHTIDRRTKEIGIRKVLGANNWILNYLLSKQFLIMMGISIIIAAPISYYVNNMWLNYMVVRDDMGIGTVLIGALILITLGLLTIIPLTTRIAVRNPVEALKVE